MKILKITVTFNSIYRITVYKAFKIKTINTMSKFPKTVKRFLSVDGKVSKTETFETQFNLIELLPENLVREFGEDMVVKTVMDLNLSLSDLVAYQTVSNSKHSAFILPKGFYSIHMKANKSYWDSKETITVYYDEYTLMVASHISYGKILNHCILDKYPELKALVKEVEYKFDPFEANNTHMILNRIPEFFKNFTVNELLAFEGVQTHVVKESVLKCYSFESDLDLNNYVIYLEVEKGSSLFVPYIALKEKNVQLIKDRTTDYYTNYWRNNESKMSEALESLNSDNAKLLFSILS